MYACSSRQADVDGIHASPPETELVRDMSREFNGLRRGTARPIFFDPKPAKKKRRVKRVETLANPHCNACGYGDSEEVLECRSCHMLIHLKCMEPPLENVPERVWYCATCRDSFQFSKLEDHTPCARCGVADKINGPACDRCDAVYHADCLNVTELSRYNLVIDSVFPWYCEHCHDHAKRDKELSLQTEKLWVGIENHNKIFTQDEPSIYVFAFQQASLPSSNGSNMVSSDTACVIPSIKPS
jgi:hypothetical protein